VPIVPSVPQFLPRITWFRTWYAPCDQLVPPVTCADLSTPGPEFRWIQVPQGTVDRLTRSPVQPARNGNAMRVNVLDGDFAWNPCANQGQGGQISGGWRAEAVGPIEHETSGPIRYRWSTMLDPNYVLDPRVDDSTHKNHGKPTWQVIFQWHQGDDDKGGAPPVAFIIVGDNILLDLHKPDPKNDANSLHVGQWPVANLSRGTWHDFTVEIRWHQTDGLIKVAHNGQQVVFNPQVPAEFPNQPPYPAQATDTLRNVPTLFPSNNAASVPSVYMKVGLYRQAVNTQPAGPFTLYHDEISRWEYWIRLRPFPWEVLPWPVARLKQFLPKPPPPPPPFSHDWAAVPGETLGGQPGSG
jgi:Polysaccharide lyase